MEKFDIKSAKYVSIIILICFIFIMVVWNAFKYLPSESKSDLRVNNAVTVPGDEENADIEEQNSNVEEESAEEEVSDNSEETPQPEQKVQDREKTASPEPLEAIDEETGAPAAAQVSVTFEDVLSNAKNLKDDKQYVKALSEYQKAVELASDNKAKASCYEEISTIYAISKRYGTALAYAQKAYNLAPSSSREVLLARLYYKTGDIDKATRRVNNVLQREFTAD